MYKFKPNVFAESDLKLCFQKNKKVDRFVSFNSRQV